MRAAHRHQLGLFSYQEDPASLQKQDEDSLQIEEVSREGPQPIKLGSRNYELTFKKDQKQQYFLVAGKQVQRSLLDTSDKKRLSALRHPVLYYYQLPLEDLSSLPFADLYSLQLSEKDQKKLSLIGQILELKRLQVKTRSVGINLRCLSLKDSPSSQQKHKLYLLQLLQKQLNKKHFIQALKVNYMHRQYLKQFQDQEGDNSCNYPRNPEQMSPHLINEELQQEIDRVDESREDELGKQKWNEPSMEQNQEQSQLGDQLLIFIQVVSALVKKQKFLAFNTVMSTAKRSQRTTHQKTALVAGDLSPILAPRKEDIIIKSPKILSSEHLYNEEHQNQGELKEYWTQKEEEAVESSLQEQQNKLGQLYEYMQELHEECAETSSMARKYFLKWKIYLLEAIAQSMISHMKQEEEQNQQLEQQQPGEVKEKPSKSLQQNREDVGYDQQQHFDEPASYNRNSWSRATSQVSQGGEQSLKQQKSELRAYLFHKTSTTFFTNLRSFFQSQRIKSIIFQVREQKYLKTAFAAFKVNFEEERRMREMSGYYEQMASQQNDDDHTAYFFWKTNLLHKYFKFLCQNLSNSKMIRLLQQIVLKVSFRAIRFRVLVEQRNKGTIQRWEEQRRKKLMFKCFSEWKLSFKNSSRHYSKMKVFRLMKQKQLMEYYFSILKLEYKKRLIKMMKAGRHYSSKLKSKVFGYIKILAEDGRQLKEKEYSLHEYLLFKRSISFMGKFGQYYNSFVEYQRFTVREEKLRRMIIELHALRGIKRWRALHMKKNVYSIIEKKLASLTNKQKKREIFIQWLQRTIQSASLSHLSQSDRHKQWLVQYYSGLCSVLPNEE